MDRILYPGQKTEKDLDMKTLTTYRDGWASGDTDKIMSVVQKETYIFTWVPANDQVKTERFPEFFEAFKKNAEAVSGNKFLIKWSNMIQRKEGDVIYELGDWFIEGFTRGT